MKRLVRIGRPTTDRRRTGRPTTGTRVLTLPRPSGGAFGLHTQKKCKNMRTLRYKHPILYQRHVRVQAARLSMGFVSMGSPATEMGGMGRTTKRARSLILSTNAPPHPNGKTRWSLKESTLVNFPQWINICVHLRYSRSAVCATDA